MNNNMTNEQAEKAAEVEKQAVELLLEGKEDEAASLVQDELGVFIAETVVDNYVAAKQRNIFTEEELDEIRAVEKEATRLALDGDKEAAVALVNDEIGKYMVRDILNNYKRAFALQKAMEQAETEEITVEEDTVPEAVDSTPTEEAMTVE